METEKIFVICAAVVALAVVAAFYNGSMSGDKVRLSQHLVDVEKAKQYQARYEKCLETNGSWVPLDNGMCLRK